MYVTRPVPDSEEEEEEEEEKLPKKGKKRQAEPADRVKKERKGKDKAEEKPKPKPKPRAKARQRAAPKTKINVVDSEDGEDGQAMEVEVEVVSDDGEPRQKRPRVTHGKKLFPSRGITNICLSLSEVMYEQLRQDKRIAVLETQMTAFNKVAEETTQTSRRVDEMEGQVRRVTGTLELFLSRISIDERP